MGKKKKKKQDGMAMHVHINPITGVPVGKAHPEEAQHKKKSTQKYHEDGNIRRIESYGSST